MKTIKKKVAIGLLAGIMVMSFAACGETISSATDEKIAGQEQSSPPQLSNKYPRCFITIYWCGCRHPANLQATCPLVPQHDIIFK